MNFKKIFFTAAITLAASSAGAQDFDHYFDGRSLRLDYIFAGDSGRQAIYFRQAVSAPEWAGRRHNLSKPCFLGNGQITVRPHNSDSIIYINTFSTLFQEWQSEAEAATTQKAFEQTCLVPMPKEKVDVTVSLTDFHNRISSQMTHTIDPTDILIRPARDNGIKKRYLMHNGATADCIDIAIVAEGYTEQEMEKFYNDCQRTVDAIFTHEPFASMKNKFNVITVAAPSEDSGVSIPKRNDWKSTPAGSRYSTNYIDRYLMTENIHKLNDILGDTPYEHIILLANTAEYGGGGIYNHLTMATSDHPTFKEVMVHEFGHSFGGLGDEYEYGDQIVSMYPSDTEPWEPNLTTLKDFNSKWADMVPKGTAIPTPPAKIPYFRDAKTEKEKRLIDEASQKVGVFEGGGYQSKGVYRPAQECRMKINEVKYFCPVCTRALKKVTEFYTGKEQ